MEYIDLCHSDIKVSRLCMGGCPMGGYGWGQVEEDELIGAVRTALENGVNYFDTADTYGLGQSEITLAKALGADRRNAVIQTKFGVKAGHGATKYDNSPEYIRQALEASLRRLGTDCIDVYVMHYWDGVTPPAEIIGELERQRDAGKIRFIGVSNICEDRLADWAPFKDRIVNAQYEFSLACRTNETAIVKARDLLGSTPLTWGSLGQGVLTGKYDSTARFDNDDRRSRDIYVNFHGEKLLRNLKIVEKLRETAAEHNKTVAACAIRFILDHLRDSVAIVGAKRPEQVLSNLEAMDWNLTETELSELDHASLQPIGLTGETFYEQ